MYDILPLVTGSCAVGNTGRGVITTTNMAVRVAAACTVIFAVLSQRLVQVSTRDHSEGQEGLLCPGSSAACVCEARRGMYGHSSRGVGPLCSRKALS